MRAILLARATATTLNGLRARSCVSHGYFSGCRRACFNTACAPTTRMHLRYWSPCFEIGPSFCLPPVEPSAAIADFLNRALAGGALMVAELEAKARAAGLLRERQEIQHAKAFKKAKKALGIRSIRDGFGGDGKWAWLLPPASVPAANESRVAPETDVNRQARPVSVVNTADRLPTELEGRIPQQWGNAIA